MEKVTLTITSDGGHDYFSDVRIISGNPNQIKQISQVTKGGSSNISLGNLDELKNSHLFINTIAKKGHSESIPKIDYRISYGGSLVDHTIIESKFNDNQTALFNFTFSFCPRFPFC